MLRWLVDPEILNAVCLLVKSEEEIFHSIEIGGDEWLPNNSYRCRESWAYPDYASLYS